MNIYFHIDELNRDAVVASALKRIFSERGHNLVYGNRISNRLLRHLHSAFDVIIVPRPHIAYDNWGDDWMSWDAKIVMLSTESLGIICKDHQVMARTLLEKEYFEGVEKYVDRIDAFCLWGSKQLQAVVDYAEEVSHKCHVVGHPRQDKLCLVDQKNRDETTPRGKKTVGVLTRAVGLNDYFGRSALDGFSTLLDDSFQYEFFNRKTGENVPSKRPGSKPAEALIVQAIDAESTIRVIASLVGAGHDVQVRIHPKEKPEVWERLLAQCNLDAEVTNQKLPISTWLEGLEYVVGPPSTSFYDAVMLGVTPISISELDPRRKRYVGELWEDNNRLMDHVFKPGNIQDLLGYIADGNRFSYTDEVLNVLKEEADYPDCGDALSKVVSACEAVMTTRRNKSIPLMSFMVLRHLFFKIWKARNAIRRYPENSAYFSFDGKTTRFIDGLSSAK
jgi:hypothetical protein